MRDPIGIVEEWAGGILKDDITLQGLVSGVYSGQATEGANWPYLTLGEWTSRPTQSLNGEIVIQHVDFEAIVITKGDDSFVPAETIQSRVFELLHQNEGSLSGGSVYGCLYESSSRDAYSIDSIPYRVQANRFSAVVR